jgi:hypothetical protein
MAKIAWNCSIYMATFLDQIGHNKQFTTIHKPLGKKNALTFTRQGIVQFQNVK